MGATCCTNEDISTIDANVPPRMSAAKLVAKACIKASTDETRATPLQADQAAVQTDKDPKSLEQKTETTKAPVA